jgi:hypothetical protein
MEKKRNKMRLVKKKHNDYKNVINELQKQNQLTEELVKNLKKTNSD